MEKKITLKFVQCECGVIQDPGGIKTNVHIYKELEAGKIPPRVSDSVRGMENWSGKANLRSIQRIDILLQVNSLPFMLSISDTHKLKLLYFS